MSDTPQTIVVVNQKSVGIAILLSVFFGPLGMFYSTVMGGLTMLVVSTLGAIVTLGMSLIVTWPICVLWAAVAASSSRSHAVSV